MNDAKIRPALSAEDWAGFLEAVANPNLGGHYIEIGTHAGEFAEQERHEAAAKLLYGQPFGFTREDVDLLWQWKASLRGDYHEHDQIDSLIARIESLLPPEPAP